MATLDEHSTMLLLLKRVELAQHEILRRLDVIESKIEPTAIEEAYEGSRPLTEDDRYLRLTFKGVPMSAKWYDAHDNPIEDEELPPFTVEYTPPEGYVAP